MQNIMCFAKGHEGAWEALCVDYDIAVQGVSFDDVRRELIDAIQEYVSVARAEDDQTRIRLLSRRAPMHVRLAWIARIAWSGIQSRMGGETSAAFPVACAT